MHQWTLETLSNVTEFFDAFNDEQQRQILDEMNSHYPPHRFYYHLENRRRALMLMDRSRKMLSHARQQFPHIVKAEEVSSPDNSLKGFSVVFTAGGEGERLKTTLLEKGVPESKLRSFTKATFGLPGFFRDFGTLHINLSMISSLCRKLATDIPVVVTTGPAGSVTAEVIPWIIRKHDNFGLKHLRIIPQEERLFFSNSERIVFQETGNGSLFPITHPDETGGPLMKLKQPGDGTGPSILDWFASFGCSRTIAVQATALYHPVLLPLMASALGEHDCLGVGILRTAFPESDPYGTFVTLKDRDSVCTVILEQDVRNDVTRSLTDKTGRYYLPFNTGLYAFNNTLLSENDLPDFATPPKMLHPDLPRAPKIGYAAVDLITLAGDPVILTIVPELFGVLKNAGDLERLSTLGREFNLDAICAETVP